MTALINSFASIRLSSNGGNSQFHRRPLSLTRRRLTTIKAADTETNQVKAQVPDKAPAKDGSSFNQLLGIKGASQETNKWKIHLQLTKPVTWPPLIWGVVCGAAASGNFQRVPEDVAKAILCMTMSGPCLTGYTQTLSDWYDREIDAINEPYRPIPSGAIGENEVITQIWVLLLAGLGIAGALDVWLIQNGWIGNFALGSSYIGLPWWAGQALFGTLTPDVIVLRLLYSVAGLGIAIVNDFKSIEGHKAMGLQSLPVAFGSEKAMWIFDHQIDFKPTVKLRPCFAALTAVLPSFPELKGGGLEQKPRIERLAEEFEAIPARKRPEFVENLIKKRVGSKNITYFNDLMEGLLIVQELNVALKVFDEMPLHGVLPNLWTYSILIRYYCRKNDPDEGKKVLDCMIENGFRPNVVTLSFLVSSFSSRGRVQRALEVIELMGLYGCKPNVHTYNCVLKGLCFVGRVEEANKMLMDLKTKGVSEESVRPNIHSFSTVMDGLCKVGRTQEAMELLDEAIAIGLTPNVVTYNAIFNGYCKQGKPKKGFWLLKMMKDRNCVPDRVSYSTLLHGLLKWGEVIAALSVYNQMLEVGFQVEERLMNTLLRALCRKSQTEKDLLKNAYQVFDKMKSWDYAIYPDTYYLIIQTFCIGNEIDNALITMNEMIGFGYFPRMVTINQIIHGLCKKGRIRKALSVLVTVCEASRIPSKISCNILIEELSKKGHLLEASSVYASALKLGVVPYRNPCVFSEAKFRNKSPNIVQSPSP